jgi:cytochrome b6-f complex iron-sulfur subunit
MGNTTRRPDEGTAFDPRSTPVPRRSMLILMGAGAVVASGGLGAVLAACSGPPQTVTLDFDPATLVPGTPQEVPFTVVVSNGERIPGSTWLLRTAEGDLVAYDPRCTHGLCRYNWTPAISRFECQCHEGEFALDGTVLAGAPPKPLVRFPVREIPGTGIEVDVPSDFETPKESLPA